MSSMIRIPVPALDGSEDLVVFAQDNTDLLAVAMDCEVREFDSKAQVDSLKITSVDVQNESVRITYTIAWSASDTCRDIEFAGTQERVLRGQREGSFWVFRKHQPTPGRSTLDEF